MFAVVFVRIKLICAVEMSSVQRIYQYSGDQHKILVLFNRLCSIVSVDIRSVCVVEMCSEIDVQQVCK